MEFLAVLLGFACILTGWAMCLALTNREDHPPIPPAPRQLCEWLAPCPVCGRHEALVHVHSDGLLHQGEEVECARCGNKGTIEVYGPEEVDVNWEGE